MDWAGLYSLGLGSWMYKSPVCLPLPGGGGGVLEGGLPLTYAAYCWAVLKSFAVLRGSLLLLLLLLLLPGAVSYMLRGRSGMRARGLTFMLFPMSGFPTPAGPTY